MYSRIKIVHNNNTSTPKRRRLGTGRILRRNIQIFDKENNILQSPNVEKDGLDDLPLPCNQMEYLCDPGNNNSTTSTVPCSPDVLESSVVNNIENWPTLVARNDVNKGHKDASVAKCKELDEIEDISDDMFYSKLEQQSSQPNHVYNTLLTTRCEKNFRENVEESFDSINQSICNILNEKEKKINNSILFDTKDSFLLDIKESGIEKVSCKQNIVLDNKESYMNSFYGLPMIVKGLFKNYRNIEKFYDWQEECLNLDAIKDRRNLIYALPTSGGKTLVAEILMLREVMNRKHNALFILPYVAIVQEKIWSLSPFAVKLDFLVEEYAAGKGHIPPKKRRKKKSIYIATIEKGLALVRSLIELDRLDELGLIVVDELHLIGEAGRGATLETLLTTVLYTKKDIQIVGMSATIGNLPELARFLRADVFRREFRPVELHEFVKLGDMLHRLVWTPEGLEVLPHRQLAFDYSAAGTSLDPDRLGGLVAEVVPRGSCLVFCPTKRNCENVAALLCKLQRREMLSHRTGERAALERALRGEGASSELARDVRCGIAYHHAGLAGDERTLLEQAFRAGVISVLCCTSTLAAGVNLPAQRVIVRAPLVGRDLISLGAYRQMVGRAGRAGQSDIGESIIICGAREWPALRSVLGGGLAPARSTLRPAAPGLLLSAVALRLATTRTALQHLLECTLMATADPDTHGIPVDVGAVCDEALQCLLQSGALEALAGDAGTDTARAAPASSGDCELAVSQLGRAAIKGCMELSVAQQLLQDLELASRALVVMDSLHLLYLVTPHDGAGVRPDYRHYYSLYCNLDEEGIQTAKVLGITEMNAIRMMTGKPITNVPERAVRRFYLALMLRDLWRQVPFSEVANKYCVPRGTVQAVMSSAAAFASGAARLCAELPPLWPFGALLTELAPRLQHCAAPELRALMELPAVKKSRALQLSRLGYKRVEQLAQASPDHLAASVAHLSRTQAKHLVSAARMMLIEKVENLRAEAEEVMADLNV